MITQDEVEYLALLFRAADVSHCLRGETSDILGVMAGLFEYVLHKPDAHRCTKTSWTLLASMVRGLERLLRDKDGIEPTTERLKSYLESVRRHHGVDAVRMP